MDGRKVGEHNCSRHAYVQLVSIARACASESVKNKEAWKRGKDKGRDKGEGEEKEAGSWSLETR